MQAFDFKKASFLLLLPNNCVNQIVFLRAFVFTQNRF